MSLLSEFNYSDGVLIIKEELVYSIGDNYEGLLDFSYPVADDCSWETGGHRGEDISDMSYNTMKREITNMREGYVIDDFIDSPGELYVTVENGKVTCVNYSTP